MGVVGERTSSLAMARIKFVSLIYAGVVASQSVLDRACNYVTDCKAFNAQCDCVPDMDLFNAGDRSPAGPWCKDKAESKCKCKTGFQEYTYAEPKAFTIGEKTETFAVGCEDPKSCAIFASKCGTHSSCTQENDSGEAQCKCEEGYEQAADYKGDIPNAECQKIDVCKDYDCSSIANSKCAGVDKPQCICEVGFDSYKKDGENFLKDETDSPTFDKDSGYACTKTLACVDKPCGENQACNVETVKGLPTAFCSCEEGFKSDSQTKVEAGQKLTCTSEKKAEQEPEPEKTAETEKKTEPEPEPEKTGDTEKKTEPEPEPEKTAETEKKTEPEPESEKTGETEKKTEPEPEPEKTAEKDKKTEPEPEPEKTAEN